MEWTDDNLLKRWSASGDADAFRELTVRYGGMVHATCLRVLRNRSDAEDVAQECFESLATGASGPKQNVGGWLHRVATHRSISLLRSSGRRLVREERFAEGAVETREATWNEVYAFVDEAIDGLPEKFRVSVCAHFLQQRTHESIAREFGLTRSAVSYRIRVGVDRIRETLRRKGVSVEGGALMTLMASGLMQAPASAEWLERVGRIALSGQTGADHGALSWARSWGWLGAGAATLAAIIGALIILGGESDEPPASPVPEPQAFAQPVPPIDIERREVIAVSASAVPEPKEVDAIAAPVEPVAVGVVPDADEAVDEGASISGWVIDEDGVGLPGFLVHVTPDEALLGLPAVSDFEETFRHAITDAEGNFTIESIHFYGQVHVVATGAEYFDSGKYITLAEKEQRKEIELSVAPSDDFLGRVLDWEGQPIPGALIVPLEVSNCHTSHLWGNWRRTNDQGEFRFPLRHMGSSFFDSCLWLNSEIVFQVYSEVSGEAFFRGTKLTLFGYQEYRMPRPGRIHGTVKAADGTAAAGYMVKLSGRELDDETLDVNQRSIFPLGHSAITDESGGYEIDGLAPSVRYGTALYSPDGRGIRSSSAASSSSALPQSNRTPSLQPGAEYEWNLVIRDERWIEGTVRGALSGKKLPGTALVSIGVYDAGTKRQVGGVSVDRDTARYRLSLPRTGRHVIVARYFFFKNHAHVSAPNALPWSDGDWIIVEEGPEDLHQDLTVKEPFAFSVRVVDGDGRPCEGVDLDLFGVFPDYEGDYGVPHLTARTDRDGRYTWHAKPGEEVWITTHDENYKGGVARSKTPHIIGRAGETYETELVLREKGAITGRYVRRDGSAARDVQVRIARWNEQGQELGTIQFHTEYDGTFRAEGMLSRDRLFVNLQYRREWVWSEPLFYEGPADVDLDLGDIVVPE